VNATVKLEAGTLIINWRNLLKEEFGEESGTGGCADPMAFPFDWHKDLILNFAKSINTNKKFEITGKEALKVHYLIDAMLESSKKNKLITME
jgi:Predicted dehydrogenases and related proteins